MKSIIVCSFFVLILVNQVLCGIGKCGPDSHLVRCKSCCKQPSCFNREVPKCPSCPKDCKPACVCNPGFILEPEGRRCIPIGRCPIN
ncbi:unnamed protein product [Psylliodes chrysocephalus]|uniref:TIL domain-containing protein n=1 Tax=Psylliodes chrysocephalus TaxID=3402493 RepID=A0A9P0CMA3_9CUCU|nr:unnamed protein product [Psylliodes chrysocephala]